MNFEIDEKIPIYVQIIDYIKKRIIIGELKGGDEGKVRSKGLVDFDEREVAQKGLSI